MKISQRDIFCSQTLCKRGKICYNKGMKDNREEKRGFIANLIGEKTPPKISGVSYSLFACCLAVVSLFLGLFLEDGSTQWEKYLSFLVAPIAFILVSIWYFISEERITSFVKEQNCSVKYYVIALLMQIGLLSLGEVNGWFLRFLGKFGYENTSMQLPSVEGVGIVGVLFTIAVLPAIVEELFFRGILLKGMKGFSLWGQVLLCGGLFALYHQNPAQTVYQFACGAAFALVAVKAGSFFPTVLSHFINNALVIVLYACGVESYPMAVYIPLVLVSGLCLVGTVAYLLVFDKKQTEKQTGKQTGNYKEFFRCAALGIIVFGLTWLLVLATGC